MSLLRLGVRVGDVLTLSPANASHVVVLSRSDFGGNRAVSRDAQLSVAYAGEQAGTLRHLGRNATQVFDGREWRPVQELTVRLPARVRVVPTEGAPVAAVLGPWSRVADVSTSPSTAGHLPDDAVKFAVEAADPGVRVTLSAGGAHRDRLVREEPDWRLLAGLLSSYENGTFTWYKTATLVRWVPLRTPTGRSRSFGASEADRQRQWQERQLNAARDRLEELLNGALMELDAQGSLTIERLSRSGMTYRVGGNLRYAAPNVESSLVPSRWR